MESQALAPDAPWIVLKFGGTSVSTHARWQTIAGLMHKRRVAEGARVLTVVSALSGVTDQLSALCQTGTDGTRRAALVDALCKRHLDFVAELAIGSVPMLEQRLAELARLADDPRAADAPFVWQAEVLALGELCSSAIGAALLQAGGLPVRLLDSRDFLKARTDGVGSAWARHLSVNCEVRADRERAATLAGQGEYFLAQGFIARDDDGRTAILGRGGSDTSASYFGALLSARRVEIWTDVPGMFSANPRTIPQARLLKRLDYDEAQEIATTGAKVLHPRAIGPVRETAVPLWIKDTQRPDLEGTVIAPMERPAAPSVKALSWRSRITLVAMESLGMWQQVGFLADVFAAFKRHGLSVDLIGSSETNVTVSLDPSDNLLDADTLRRLCEDLEQVCRVKVIAPCAAVTLVGRGMRRLLDRLGAVFAEVGNERVHLLTQSANDLNLTFVVDEAALGPLLPRLHAALLASGLLAGEDPDVLGPSWTELAEPPAARDAGAWWQQAPARRRLLEIAQTQSPAYVYDLLAVRQRAEELKSLKAISRWFYALKANPHPQILRTLVAAGFGLECVSLAELERARTLVPAGQALYTPNFVPRAELAAALALGCQLTVDNAHVLEHWGELLAGHPILLRVDLGSGHGHHDKVRTGGVRSKFGIGIAELGRARTLAQRAGAQVVGLHAHLGSGIADPRHWAEVGAQLLTLADGFPQLRVLNLGGGLGVPARASDPALDLTVLGRELMRLRELTPLLELWMEPGRWPVADAGVLLATVTQLKHKSGVDFVGVDAGMNSLLRPALYDAWHGICNLSRPDGAPQRRYEVVGPICESGDVLGHGRLLPECREGDVLLVAQAGAYGAAMGSHYNLRPPATEVIL